MPSPSPKVSSRSLARLARLGETLRRRRRALGVTATTTARAAGISRTTLHRIEKGEPSVTLGAYQAVISALGLELRIVDPEETLPEESEEQEVWISVDAYPELSRLAWHIPNARRLSPEEVFAIYETKWRYVDPARLDPEERALIERLSRRFGGGRRLV